MAKFVWRGREEEDIKKIELSEFKDLVTARERRKLKRGFSEREKKFIEKLRKYPDKMLKTRSRDMLIIPEMIGRKIGVYDGKEYVQLEIRAEMIGHRLGEYVLTRKMVKHSSPGFGATKSSKFVPLK